MQSLSMHGITLTDPRSVRIFTKGKFSLGWLKYQSRQLQVRSVCLGPTLRTFAGVAAARIHGIGKSSRNSSAFRGFSHLVRWRRRKKPAPVRWLLAIWFLPPARIQRSVSPLAWRRRDAATRRCSAINFRANGRSSSGRSRRYASKRWRFCFPRA